MCTVTAREMTLTLVRSVTAGAMLLTGSMAATAVTLFDTGAPSHYQSSSNTTGFIIAGQFSLGENSTLTGAGVYLVSQDPALPNLEGWDGTFEYFLYTSRTNFQFHHDIPDTLLASGTAQSLGITDTGVPAVEPLGSVGTIWLFEFEFEEAFGTTAGLEYWLGIHTADNYVFDPLDLSGLGWALFSGGTLRAFDFGGTGNFSFATEPNEHPVPMFIEGVLGCERDCHPYKVREPGTLGLLGLGLLGLGLKRSRAN